MSDHLKNLSQVYLEQIAKSAVPVDEAHMSGATSIKDAKPEKLDEKVKYDPNEGTRMTQVERKKKLSRLMKQRSIRCKQDEKLVLHKEEGTTSMVEKIVMTHVC